MTESYSLMIHGGAGTRQCMDTDPEPAAGLASLRAILEQGREILASGGSALQAVETCASLLEDDPRFNAGRGSVLNADGRVEMDAAIMDGRDLSAGAVAAVSNIANPVRLARLVLAHSPYVMLAGTGALRFAASCGLAQTPDDYFMTEARLQQYLDARREAESRPDHAGPGIHPVEEQDSGTVGAIARDLYGNLAAATSTGGVTNKPCGRVGDSPIIGAGVYADNASCAVSATGHGEAFMRTVLARAIAAYIELLDYDAARAARAGIDYLAARIDGQGGVIVIDSAGRCASRFTPGNMIHGWIERGGAAVCTCRHAIPRRRDGAE